MFEALLHVEGHGDFHEVLPFSFTASQGFAMVKALNWHWGELSRPVSPGD